MLLRQIRYFLAVAQEGHFRRAAERIRVAQPALSRQVALLEESLGVTLFERLPRGVQLSVAGRTFMEHCSRILADLDRAVAETQAVDRGRSGSLDLGFIEVAAWNGPLPRTILAFRRQNPGVGLVVHSMTSLDQLDGIRTGRLDAGFLYNPPADERGLSVLPVARHRVLLAVEAGSPLAGRKSIPMGELAGLPLVLFHRPQSPIYHDELTAAFLNANVPLNVAHLAHDEAAMLALVTTGHGAALVNECQKWRPPQGVAFIDIEGLDVFLDLAFVYRAGHMTPALRNFLEVLESERDA